MKKTTGFYPRVRTDRAGKGVVSQAGGSLLTATIRTAGLDRAVSVALAPWRKPMAIHDPAKVLLDLAVALGLGGGLPGRHRPAARRTGRVRAGRLRPDGLPHDRCPREGRTGRVGRYPHRPGGRASPGLGIGRRQRPAGIDAQSPLVIDVDATLVDAHSEKEQARPTFKKGFGHHPLWAFLDHGPAGTGEPLSLMLRAGNAGSNTAADHLVVIREALRQLPFHRSGKVGWKVLVRIDGADATHEVLDYLVARGMSYSVGFTLPTDFETTLWKIPKTAWVQAYDAEAKPREGPFVAEVTDLMNLSQNNWPAGMRVIIRKERPHPGAQLRITDIDGNRITAFATNTPPGAKADGDQNYTTQLPDLELRHRRRARCEDRIRCAKDTGLMNLPLHDFAQNQIWCAIVALACEITAWMQMLAPHGHQARRWEPKRLRLRLLSIAGLLATSSRITTLHLSAHAPWGQLVLDGIHRLRTLAALPEPAG